MLDFIKSVDGLLYFRGDETPFENLYSNSCSAFCLCRKKPLNYKTKPLNATVKFSKKNSKRYSKAYFNTYLHANNSIYQLEKGITISCVYREKTFGDFSLQRIKVKDAMISYFDPLKLPAQIKEINIEPKDSVLLDFKDIKLIAHLNEQNFIILEEAK